MVMLTYIARTGREVPLSSESDCADAIRAGDLHRESPVMDGRTGRWMKAAEHGAVAGLLARVAVEGRVEPADKALKVVTVTAWLAALVGPPLIAWALGAPPVRILQRFLAYTVVLAAVGAAVGFSVKSRRRRWALALLVAILAFLAFAAGLGPLAKSTSALASRLAPAVTSLFAPGAK